MSQCHLTRLISLKVPQNKTFIFFLLSLQGKQAIQGVGGCCSVFVIAWHLLHEKIEKVQKVLKTKYKDCFYDSKSFLSTTLRADSSSICRLWLHVRWSTYRILWVMYTIMEWLCTFCRFSNLDTFLPIKYGWSGNINVATAVLLYCESKLFSYSIEYQLWLILGRLSVASSP